MLYRLGCALLMLTLLGGCALRVSENNVVIPRPGAGVVGGKSDDGRWSVQSLLLQRGAGVLLQGALYTRPDAVATVLYFGGNGFVLSRQQQQLLNAYAGLPVNIAVFDHRGYGGSNGIASMQALYADGVAVYDYVRALPAIHGQPLLVHGHSLGSFVAGRVAEVRRIDGLVLEASATTTSAWLAGRVPYLGWVGRGLAWLVLDADMRRHGNARVVRQLDEPLLVVVGAQDKITRPAMARALFRDANLPESDKFLLLVPGATHMDAAGKPEYAQAFDRLLRHVRALPHTPARMTLDAVGFGIRAR